MTAAYRSEAYINRGRYGMSKLLVTWVNVRFSYPSNELPSRLSIDWRLVRV
jgi:hypothetical protein